MADLDLKDPFESLNDLLEGKIPDKKRVITGGLVSVEKAPNAIAFIEGDRYLNAYSLNPAQYRVVRDFYELLCPVCNNVERILIRDDVPRETQVLFEHDYCPNCGYFKYEDPARVVNYNSLVGVVGMRGGKSVLVAGMVAWELHAYLCVENLQEKLGLVKNQELEISFVASTGKQAAETIYGNFRNYFDASPWYKSYVGALRNLEVTDPTLRRYMLYKGEPGSTSIEFKNKHIIVQSYTSNSGGMAGRTRLTAAIDEIGRMDRGDSKISAVEVYRVQNRSLVNLRSSTSRLRDSGDFSIPDAKMLCVSSPLYEDDMIMKLKSQAQINKKMFAFHAATWEFNPAIRKEDLIEEFEADPLGAERDYGANPPGAENPFITNKEIIYAAIDKDRKSNLVLEESFFSQDVGGIKFDYVKVLLKDFKYHNLVDYCIHCDPGQNRDSFCLAIGHKDGDLYIVDGCLELKPISVGNRLGLPPREAYFPCILDLILELHKKLSIVVVTYDKWNSTDQIQRLRDNKILAVQKNMTRDDYIAALNSLKSGNFRFPSLEVNPEKTMNFDAMRNVPCARAVYELRRLNDTGQKVDHPKGGHNDMIECCVGLHRLLHSPETIITKKEIGKNLQRQSVYSFGRKSKIGSVIKITRRNQN